MVPGDRPCGDYHGLNTQTIPDRYPLPNIADFSARLHGSKVFTKLDLTKGYYQVPMSTGDIPQTAVITPFGLFQWLRMPFGLRNSGYTFQRLMDQILQGLPYCFVYVDDVLFSSPDSPELPSSEYLRRIQSILKNNTTVPVRKLL